ncbi:hypothetical protein CEXT_726401 [Caerostris extrusa]|uniref:Uncharacterized protein n=1 Tax=Caerostris extrusa TaxID=172846 RepID=A0AAV4XQF0_CAEEX|nr:hypothetical protein CEXT_726401 [Caerostris extrusa]
MGVIIETAGVLKLLLKRNVEAMYVIVNVNVVSQIMLNPPQLVSSISYSQTKIFVGEVGEQVTIVETPQPYLLDDLLHLSPKFVRNTSGRNLITFPPILQRMMNVYQAMNKAAPTNRSFIAFHLTTYNTFNRKKESSFLWTPSSPCDVAAEVSLSRQLRKPSVTVKGQLLLYYCSGWPLLRRPL